MKLKLKINSDGTVTLTGDKLNTAAGRQVKVLSHVNREDMPAGISAVLEALATNGNTRAIFHDSISKARDAQ